MVEITEIKEDYWSLTAEMYSKLIAEPEMTEDLLTRLTFVDVYKIIRMTMNRTGFGSGLYTQEESDAVLQQEKGNKIEFLTKLIMLTETIIEESVDVDPEKIVDGLEPERTNVFLRAFYQAATSGVD